VGMKITTMKRRDPYETKAGTAGCLFWSVRLAVLFVVVLAVALAGFFLFARWQSASLGSGPAAGLTTADLPLLHRLYLQGYLSSQADALAQPAGPAAEETRFIIEPGQRADQVADNLIGLDLLQDKTLFLNYLRYYGLDSQLEAGTYRIGAGLTIPELALTLIEASVQDVDLRFLEGWRIEEMAHYLATTRPAEILADDFLALARGETAGSTLDLSVYEFLASRPEGATLEGFLFPDTYRVPLDAGAAQLIGMMLDNFDQQITPAMRQMFGLQGLTVFEAVTLASIVDREAVVPDERPLIASVFLNRLRQGGLLQADPTVQYAVGYVPDRERPGLGSWWKSPLFQSDLALDSPYNTYLYPGLPPGPIANPSLGSLQAVAEPAESDFLYFVADCESETPGRHIFSLTFEEHLANVGRCR
jgi:UPF0755 protein